MNASPAGQPLDQNHPERIEVRVPARAEYVAVVRLAAAGVAGRMGFSYEDIEDLKIAVAEACTDAVLSGQGPVTVSFDVRNGALDIAVRVAPGSARPAKDRELGLFLIQCLMDEVATVEEEDGTRVMRMAKRLPPTPHA